MVVVVLLVVMISDCRSIVNVILEGAEAALLRRSAFAGRTKAILMALNRF